MKPYYDEDGITIFHADCREPGLLPLIVSLDHVITDPPYNVGLNYSGGDDRKDYEAWCSEWFQRFNGLASSTALTPGTVNVAMWCRIAAPDWIIGWHKPAAMGPSPFGVCNWEPVLFWGLPKRNRGTDVVTAGIVPDPDLSGHPCPKPEKWARGLVLLLTDVGSTVLDPFMGTGTTLRAAKDCGRKAIGIEIEERYCEIAAKRLRQRVLDFSERQA